MLLAEFWEDGGSPQRRQRRVRAASRTAAPT